MSVHNHLFHREDESLGHSYDCDRDGLTINAEKQPEIQHISCTGTQSCWNGIIYSTFLVQKHCGKAGHKELWLHPGQLSGLRSREYFYFRFQRKYLLSRGRVMCVWNTFSWFKNNDNYLLVWDFIANPELIFLHYFVACYV